MENLKISVLLVFLSMTVSVLTENFEVDNLSSRSFRLPNNTIPLHYDVRIRSDIHRGDFIFEGEVRINITVLEASDVITLQYRQLIIRTINLRNPDDSILQQNAPFRLISDLEFLEIPTNNLLAVGQALVVEVVYSGILREETSGFFRTSYVNPATNQTVWLASTHFKNTDARHAFPCYDEIGLRASFQLTIDHDSSYHAVSNMPIFAQGVTGNSMTTIFETTPLMPTHIFTFTISNFDFVSSNELDFPMHTFAQPAAIARGEANHSLSFGAAVGRYLQLKFGAYTLPKLDQIAIPGLDWSTAVSQNFLNVLHNMNYLPAKLGPDIVSRSLRLASRE